MPWYDPTNSYGGFFGVKGFENTPWGEAFFDENPQAAYIRWGASHGVPQDDSAWGRYFRQQYGRALEGFQASLGTNPNLRFMPWLRNYLNIGDIRTQFDLLAPDQRGENRGAFAPTARWINR